MRETVCVTGALLLLVPTSGFACSFTTCIEDFEVSATGLTIPANAPSIMVDTFWGGVEHAELFLEKEDGELVDISVQDEFGRHGWWRVEPLDGFEEDESYTLRIGGGNADFQVCGEAPAEFKFTTGSVEPLPTSLGSLTASEVNREKVQVDTSSSCFDDVYVAYVDVEIDLPAETRAWHGALIVKTFVNETLWDASASYGAIYKPGESWVGFGKDRVFISCDETSDSPDQAAPAGGIDIKMTGRMPGTDLYIESETISVDLRCDPNAVPEPAPAEPQPEPEPDGRTDSGCSTTKGMGGWFAIGLALFWVRRRRAI